MDVADVRVLVALGASAAALAAITAGVLLGTCSGLVPGLHVNSLALLLAAAAPSIPGPPQLVGLIPPHFGARRVHLMAVLLVPLALP